MKPTHGFKNPLIGFGERLEEGWRVSWLREGRWGILRGD